MGHIQQEIPYHVAVWSPDQHQQKSLRAHAGLQTCRDDIFPLVFHVHGIIHHCLDKVMDKLRTRTKNNLSPGKKPSKWPRRFYEPLATAAV